MLAEGCGGWLTSRILPRIGSVAGQCGGVGPDAMPDRHLSGSPLTCVSPGPLPGRAREDVGPYTMRRATAQRVSSLRLDSWSLRRTAETWVSTVLTEMNSSEAHSL